MSCDGYGVGGAIGYLSGGSIDRCFSVGNVKAGNMDTPAGYGAAGGFVGYIGGSAPISNSYCTGDVEAPDNLGGFAATVFTGAKMTNVYTLSKVTATAAAPKTVSNVCSYANDKATDANTTMSLSLIHISPWRPPSRVIPRPEVLRPMCSVSSQDAR